ncbi:glycerol kinase [Chelonobacter oris]|uniref:Glycerol kinase n=1 Tax=Chelonobacter oris TaxID=505317 RepID=A0A0A3ARR3_9PAST|nr:FGGY-family carbohydrate kinase [Chelonobacter oris]KGQ70467.1 glycerol kinase [Chelonobacter oris]
MAQPFILSIDEGTTNTKAVAINKDGKVVAKGSRPVALYHPYPGWAEQSPLEIWHETEDAIAQCLSRLDIADLSGISISNQRESVLAWERSGGKPLSPLISWQCRRTEDFCRQIAVMPKAESLKYLTGSVLDPLFPASKIHWLLDNIDNGFARAVNGEICVGTVDVWLVWQLTNGKSFVTDYSNASRYQLFNLHTAQWDKELLTLFGIPVQCLPEIISSSGYRGETLHCSVLPDGIPIFAQIGDSHAALYGQGGFHDGIVKATYGTGSSLMTKSRGLSVNDLTVSTTVAWHDAKLSFALEGNITHTGAALGFIAKLLSVRNVERLSEMAQSVESNQGVYFVPALAGLGAPYWDSKVRGMICGLTDSSTPEVIARAAFESIAYQVADLFFNMEKSLGEKLGTLSVDGGPTKNEWLMQFQADLLQREIICSDIAEVSALGAAFLAGRAIGWWQGYQALSNLPRAVTIIAPNRRSEMMVDNYMLWQQAVQRARF